MTTKAALRIEPVSTGRLMNAEEIAAEKFTGKKSARWSSDAGVNLADVMSALRHASISTTEGYARRSGRTKVAGVIGGLLTRERSA